MRGLFAITKFTLFESFRSSVFKFILLAVTLTSIVLPLSVDGDGSTPSYVRVALLYCFQCAMWLLAFGVLWLGANAMGKDVENLQLQLTVTKPVSRWTIFAGKFLGVYLSLLILLASAGIFTYGALKYELSRRVISESERLILDNEILVGRRVFLPKRIDVDAVAETILNDKLRELAENSMTIDGEIGMKRIRRISRQEALALETNIEPGDVRIYLFENIPSKLTAPLFLRFRPFVGAEEKAKQRLTAGAWQLGLVRMREKSPEQAEVARAAEVKLPDYQFFPAPLSSGPLSLSGGQFHEIAIAPRDDMVSPDNQMLLGYHNLDNLGATQILQLEDGPKLMLKVSGFAGNFIRALVLIALMLAVLCALSCAAGGVFTIPTAVFLIICYLLFGSLSTYLVTNSITNAGVFERIGHYASRVILWIVIPLQNFDVSSTIANGELIELSRLAKMFFFYFVLRTLPLMLIGGYFYSRREIGLEDGK